MFSKKIKLLFVTTAYSPIFLIWWIVSIYNILNSKGSIQIINLEKFKIGDIFNRTNLIFLFILLIIACWFILSMAESKLTKNSIEIKSIKSSDLNMNVLVFSYFLPCIEVYKKDTFYPWCIIKKGCAFDQKVVYCIDYQSNTSKCTT